MSLVPRLPTHPLERVDEKYLGRAKGRVLVLHNTAHESEARPTALKEGFNQIQFKGRAHKDVAK